MVGLFIGILDQDSIQLTDVHSQVMLPMLHGIMSIRLMVEVLFTGQILSIAFLKIPHSIIILFNPPQVRWMAVLSYGIMVIMY